jgi:hypothetical protein
MHTAEMTAAEVAATEVAATEVAATEVAAAATAACKGVRREAQRAKGDARQQHSCCLGHHDFSPDIGLRVCTRHRSSKSISVPGSDFNRIALLDASLRQCRRQIGSGQRGTCQGLTESMTENNQRLAGNVARNP